MAFQVLHLIASNQISRSEFRKDRTMTRHVSPKNLWAILAVGLMVAFFAPAAQASSFTFNVDYCGDPCLGGVPASNNGGTVTVTSPSTDIVQVVVQLSDFLAFHGALQSFAFNILNDPSLTLWTSGAFGPGQLKITDNGGGTWSLMQPAGNDDWPTPGGSSFDYAPQDNT